MRKISMKFQDRILCPFCGDDVTFSAMDSRELREWEVSRLCLRCQTETFDKIWDEDPYPQERKVGYPYSAVSN